MQTDETDPEPERLAFDEKINVAVTVARECAGAEKHDDADDQHRQHSEKQKISALAMHQFREAMAPTENCVRAHLLFARSSSLFGFRLGRNDQFLSDLQFVRIIDVVQPPADRRTRP